MTCTVHRRLAPVETTWRELGEAVGGPVERFEWAASCLDMPGWRGDVWVATISREGRPAAVGPFAVKRVRGARRRVMLGVDVHREPMDLLARDPEALEDLARALAADRLPIEFGRLPADAPSVAALRRAFRGRWFMAANPMAKTPYITLDTSWVEPESHLSSGRRSDFRRARRRAERMGDVTAEILVPTEDGLDALLDEAFAVEVRSWKGEAGTAILCDPEEEAFIRGYAHRACREGVLRLSFLRIDGVAVAMQIAMVAGGGFWLLKIGYDARYATCSPGILLLRESIAEAARSGLTSFEFLGRCEPWIAVWAECERETVALYAYPFTPAGAWALMADGCFKVANQARRRGAAAATGLRSAARRSVRSVGRRVLTPVMARVARRYLAGDSLDDALRVRARLAGEGIGATLGFWDGPEDGPQEVAARYAAAIDGLGDTGAEDYVSMKLPALGLSPALLGEAARRAAVTRRRVHLDALAPEVVPQTRAAVEQALSGGDAVAVGVTLPGRWRRSLEDADWACELGLPVRVVKGEWPDPDDPDRDLREGYLEVVDRLCGRAAHVSVATHDPGLAREAITRLRAAGTPVTLELLYGLPMRASIRDAREMGVGVRVYVPYGHAYAPYALSQLRKRPGMALWLARDLVASLARPGR